MKKLVLILGILVGAAHGQIQYPYILNPPVTPPSGACAGPQIQVLATNGHIYTCNNGTWTDITAAGSGTVTSVTFTGDGVVDSSTPSTAVTTSGTVAATLNTQAANTVFGNFTGGVAAPTFSAAPAFAGTNITGTAAGLTAGNATAATASTNLAGGALGSAPYQSAAATTTFIASPTTTGHRYLYTWAPAGSAIAPTALDITQGAASNFIWTGGGTQTGTNTVIIDPGTGRSATMSGGANTIIGFQAGNALTSSPNNTLIGLNAGQAMTSGSGFNVLIGSTAGAGMTTGSLDILLGAATVASNGGDTNEIIIGSSFTGKGSNTASIGNASTTDVWFGTGLARLNASGLLVNGKFVASGQTSATTAQTLVTTTATSTYQINAVVTCDTTVAAATVTLTIAYTDPSSTAQTLTPSAAACTTLGTASSANVTQTIRAKTGTTITAAAAISGSPNYDISATALQLTSN